jgi:photosystem II stability/assembly factor-like uncharacterized protein
MAALALAAPAQSLYPSSFSLRTTGTASSARIPSNSISHVSISGSNLWIGTGKGLGQSTDGGRSWKSYLDVPQFARPGIYAIAVHGDTIWCATGYNEVVNDVSVQTGSGYAYTLDGGQTWSGLPQVLDSQADTAVQYGNNTVHFLPIVVPEQNVTFDVALGSTTVWIASWSSGIRSSSDRGATWRRAILPSQLINSISPGDSLGYYSIDPRNDNNFLGFSVALESDSIIWAGTAGGVNRSSDGGISWRKFTRDNELQHILSDWVIAIGIQRFSSHVRVWTTNWPAEGAGQEYGVSYTDDDGATWKNFLNGVKAYDFSFRDSIAYVASDGGLYRTADGGKTWERNGTIVDAVDGTRLASPAFYAVGAQGDTVYGGSSEGLTKTVDNASSPFGETWSVYRTYQPLPGRSSTYAYPNPFSPSSEQLRIHYTTGTSEAAVTIELFDFGMNRIRTLLRNASRTGEKDELWDGRTDSGRQVVNGVYFYRVKIGTDDPVWGKILVLQ